MTDLNRAKRSVINDSLNHNDSSYYLRVYIRGNTAVVKKEAVTLREALHKKLKVYNLNIDNCLPFIKETKCKIDWNILLNKIDSDSISLIKVEEDTKHIFARSLFHIKNNAKRTCDSCRKRLIIYVNSCKNCNYSICSRDDCKLFSEQILCMRDLVSTSSSYSIFNKIRRKDSVVYVPNNDNSSKQILPVTQIRPCLSYRMRSSSNSELKILDSKEDSSSHTDEEITVEKRTSKRPRNAFRRSSRWNSVISCEIPFNTVQVSNKIGTGSYGYVHKALIPNDTNTFGSIVAIKFLNVKNPTPYQAQLFRNEIAILKSTKHDNILSFVGCILAPHLAIVTEWCPGSSLYRHIHVDEALWHMSLLIDISKQISAGMEYLHNKNILHRDLKSNNIFLIPKESTNDLPSSINNEQNFKVKIGDFGLAMITTINKYELLNKSNNLNGSILWMAPEVITQKLDDSYSTKSDVYSFGVVLYEIMSGKLPYMKKEQNMILFLVGSGRLKLSIEEIDREDVPNEIKDLILTCTKYERNDRLEFIEINQKFNLIKLDEKPRVLRRHSLPDINTNPKNSYICSKFVLKESGERFNDIKIDLVEDYLESDDINNNTKNIDQIHEK